MAAPAHILVFDSGVGALSIIAEIQQQIPQCSITYASDNAFFPYGDREESGLIRRVDAVLKQLVRQTNPDIIVVACNTASTVALPAIREHFKIPSIGVVPAIKPAALHSRSRVIGLLATPGTVKRDYTNNLINEFAGDCHVIGAGSSELVLEAERKLRGEPVNADICRRVLRQLFHAERGSEIDTIVLACTHFPLIRDELIAFSPRSVTWIDSGEAIARRARFLIGEGGLALEGTPQFRSIFTAPPTQNSAFVDWLQKFLPGPVETITVP